MNREEYLKKWREDNREHITNYKKEYAKEQELIRIDYKETLNAKKYKSTLIIGNMQINNIKHFNWLQKKLWKLMFGIEIIDLEKSDKE